MKRIIIEGNRPLSGTIKIGGAKNSVVALIPAAILATGTLKIHNVPGITDKDALLEILKLLNIKVNEEDNTIILDARNIQNGVVTEELAQKLRASYYFMGALLGRFKKAEVYFPGGCKIGSRPIDIHLQGFEALGAKIKTENNKYIITADELKGTEINLRFASVGATVNIILAAVLAKGQTIINNAAKEVEIENLIEFLNNMGAKIKGAGTNTIIIDGVSALHDADITVIPDRIEAGTYIIMGSLLGDNLTIDGVNPKHLTSVLTKLKEMGIGINVKENKIIITKAQGIKATDVKTEVYPGFVTDLGQPMSVLLTQAEGISHFEETIFENRMGHIPNLQKMGAKIKFDNTHAVFYGPSKLKGAELTATDLRSGAALVTAGLIAEGTTIINDADYILRGYERIITKLSDVGAKIEITEI